MIRGNYVTKNKNVLLPDTLGAPFRQVLAAYEQFERRETFLIDQQEPIEAKSIANIQGYQWGNYIINLLYFTMIYD